MSATIFYSWQSELPNKTNLELRRLEIATRDRLTKLHETMRGNIQEARQALQSVLEGPLTMTPREDSTGREYAITGRLVLGDALAVGPAPSRQDQARGLGVADDSRPRGEPDNAQLLRFVGRRIAFDLVARC